MRHVASAFRRPARQDKHVACLERLAHRRLEHRFVVRQGAAKHRFAAVFRHCCSHNGSVGVVDLCGRKTGAGLNEFIAGRQNGDARPARHRRLGDAAGRQHADLARPYERAGAQQNFAPRDVGARVRNELPGRGRTSQIDRVGARGLRVFDHHHGVCAARHGTTRRNRRRGSAFDENPRLVAASDRLAVQHENQRSRIACVGDVARPQGETVDIGAVERRHVDRRHDVAGERKALRGCERAQFVRDVARKERRVEAGHGVFARQNGEKLFLSGAGGLRRKTRGGRLVCHVGRLV